MKYNEDIDRFYPQLVPHIRKTPLIRSEYFSKKLGCNLYLKLENIQHTHSFKVRGAVSKMLSLSEEVRKRGVIAASGGNHGLGVCYAAQLYHTTAKVYLPKSTPRHKIEKIKTYGGEAILVDGSLDEASKVAQQAAQTEERTYIHPFNDDDVIRGQATLGLEILRDLPRADAIVCSIGGGGLIGGIASYVKSLRPETKMYGVETLGTDSMYQSIHAGKIITLLAITSIADSLGAKAVAEKTFQMTQKNVDELFTVTDAEALEALQEILKEEKQLVEPAASCSLAALTTGKIKNIAGKNIVVLLCGGNFQVEVKI